MTRWAVLVLGATLAVSSPAAAVDKAKLRRAAPLPKVTAKAGVGFNAARGLTFGGEKPDPAIQLAALQKELRGDDSDAERYDKIGDLHAELKQSDRADQARGKAADLYRRRLAARPDDADALTKLGSLLPALEQGAEGEALLRRAVEAAPRAWKPLVALGERLESRAMGALWGAKSGRSGADGDLGNLMGALLAKRPSADEEACITKDLDDARDCFDRAVAAAPREAAAYLRRAQFHSMSGLMRAGLRIARGDLSTNPLKAMASPECIADLKTAAELDPDDYRGLAGAACLTVLAALMEANPAAPPRSALDLVPEADRRFVERALPVLEKFAGGKDVVAATACSEALGQIQFFLGDYGRASGHYRRVVTLNPAYEDGWDMYLALLVTAERNDDLLAASRERLKHKDTAANRYLLAKAHDKLGQDAKAEEQVRIALEREPENATYLLALAALLLRRADDAAALAHARAQLDRAEALLQQKDVNGDRPTCAVNRAICQALAGEVAPARQLLDLALLHDRNNDNARAALEALED